MRFVILLVLIAVLGASSSPIEGEAEIELADGKIIFAPPSPQLKKRLQAKLVSRPQKY